jgi:hypothetical protein
MKIRKKQLYLCFLLALAIGCANIVPIHTSKSEYHSSVELTMTPMGIRGRSSSIHGLGLYKNSNMQKKTIVLTALIKGVRIFAKGESLHFNIDDKLVSFRSIDELTDIQRHLGSFNKVAPSKSTSSKRYLIDRSFLQKIVSADKVIVKINLDNTDAEGIFTGSLAHKAFLEFEEKIESTFN